MGYRTWHLSVKVSLHLRTTLHPEDARSNVVRLYSRGTSVPKMSGAERKGLMHQQQHKGGKDALLLAVVGRTESRPFGSARCQPDDGK